MAATVGGAHEDGVSYGFAGEPPRVPPGTVVVDAASGMAVGMVPGAQRDGEEPAPAARFVTFARFHEISNAVALLPDAAAREQAAGFKPGEERGGMIWVPGGPTLLPKWMTAHYAALYGRWVACTPGFWIDKNEVTNGDYREFLLATKWRPLPAGWDEREMVNPVRAPDLPVTGVRPVDAAAYAAWRGKRLVAPVEWVRARQPAAGTPWWDTFYRALNDVSLEVRRRFKEKSDIEFLQRRLAQEDLRRRGIKTEQSIYVENDVVRLAREDFDQFLTELITNFDQHFQYPYLLVPVGFRQMDVSVYGVRDVESNAPELLLPNLAYRPVEVVPKILPARYDPDGTPVGSEITFADPTLRLSLVDPSLWPIIREKKLKYRNPLTQRELDMHPYLVGNVRDNFRLPLPSNHRLTIESQQIPVLGAGFRCAR